MNNRLIFCGCGALAALAAGAQNKPNIIYIMCDRGIIDESNATKLTEALEGDKDHSVRAQLGKVPDNKVIYEKVNKLIGDE